MMNISLLKLIRLRQLLIIWLLTGAYIQGSKPLIAAPHEIAHRDPYFGYCFDLPYTHLQLDEPDYYIKMLPIYKGRLSAIKLTEFRKNLPENIRDLSVVGAICTPSGKNKSLTISAIADFYSKHIGMHTTPSAIYCFKKKQYLETIYDFQIEGKPAWLRIRARFNCSNNALFESIPKNSYVEKAKYIQYDFFFDGPSPASEIKKQIRGK